MGEREQIRSNAESAESSVGRKAEGGEAEGENPVAAGLSYVDYAHLAGDAAVEGHTSASTFGGLMEEMGESASATFAGEETAAHTGLMAGTAIASPLSIAGGIMDLAIDRPGPVAGGAALPASGVQPLGGVIDGSYAHVDGAFRALLRHDLAT